MKGEISSSHELSLESKLEAAILAREGLHQCTNFDCYRLFDGLGDGLAGLTIDRYGPGACVYASTDTQAETIAPETIALIWQQLQPLGISALYAKPRPKNPSHTKPHPIVFQAQPAAGRPLPETITVRENDLQFEVKLYDGYSTGLFLDQRHTRTFLGQSIPPQNVLNLFAHTCALSVACAHSGARTTSVDVSKRYLTWGKQNFALNQIPIDPAQHRFYPQDAFEFARYATKKSLRYSLILIDPPTFSTGSKKGHKPWRAITHYSNLLHQVAPLLEPGGQIYASTNTAQLCQGTAFQDLLHQSFPAGISFHSLPSLPLDFSPDHHSMRSHLFSLSGTGTSYPD